MNRMKDERKKEDERNEKRMRQIRGTCFLIVLVFALSLGPGHKAFAQAADLSYVLTDIGEISVPPEVQVVGLGEASHGVAEYQEMKGEVFKALVKNNGCRTFIIEGDFGGALKVDEYICGGEGTAEESVAEIGFGIYRTREMADLVEWMRSYNEALPPEEALHFYGMDLQRFDNNKEYLFSVLEQVEPSLASQYRLKMADLNDEKAYSLDKDTLTGAEDTLSTFMKELDALEEEVVKSLGQSAFDFARECAKTIQDHVHLQLSSSYNATRDRLMYEKVQWFMEHGDGSLLFINGHNGHIGKTSIARYTCLGKLLSEDLGSGYYSIGTDAAITAFQSQRSQGGFEVMEVSNTNDLNALCDAVSGGKFFIDFATALEDTGWREILTGKQRVTTLNVSLSALEKWLKAAYTVVITPQKTYDAMIVFRQVSPMTLISN